MYTRRRLDSGSSLSHFNLREVRVTTTDLCGNSLTLPPITASTRHGADRKYYNTESLKRRSPKIIQ